MELLIVIAIIGILGAIVFPVYQEQVKKSNRGASAQAPLLELALVLERIYTENNSYQVGGVNPCLQGDDGCAQPIFKKKIYTSGKDSYYELAIEDRDGDDQIDDDYLITATPKGAAQSDDFCGTLTLSDLGQKGIRDQDEGVVAKDCW